MGGNDNNDDAGTGEETNYGDDFMDVCGTYGKKPVQ